ncbi:hypothetical protein OG422_27450 [Streptomyces sp. NBC_01525]
MAEADITYDAVSNVAYIHLTHAGEHPQSAQRVPLRPGRGERDDQP